MIIVHFYDNDHQSFWDRWLPVPSSRTAAANISFTIITRG